MRNFFIHLSMSLGFNVNPKLWFETDGFKLRENYRPQDIVISDLMSITHEMFDKSLINNEQYYNLNVQINELQEIDLKRVYVRSVQNQNVKDQFFEDEDHDHEQDLTNAIHRFTTNNFKCH